MDDYLALRRDAYIFFLNQTEDGRKYLERCWRLSQTQPDRKRLREKFNKTASDKSLEATIAK